ncbi:MAG: sulfotransferase [Rhodovibrionaceae bacterium]|nr:sulfotransferase [Rhodovibrionaceae bacterium]
MLATTRDPAIESGAIEPGAIDAGANLKTLPERTTEKRQSGHSGGTRRWYRDIARRQPDQPGAWFLLGLAARKADDPKGAREAFQRAARLRPARFEYQLCLGRACLANGAYTEARRALDTACLLKPASAAAHLSLALAHFATGAVPDAIHAARRLPLLAFKSCVRRLQRWLSLSAKAASKPGSSRVASYVALASSGRIDRDSALFRRLSALADADDLPRRERRQLNFAAGQVLHDAGETDAAFARFDAANRMKDVTFSPQAWSGHVDRLIETFDSRFFRRFEGLGHPDARPVFVVGMPRSGTGLVERIIASHPQAAGAGELEDLNLIAAELDRQLGGSYPRDLESLNGAWTDPAADRYLRRLTAGAPEAARVVDKMPGNFLHLGLIACLFPRARIVNCQRDALDTCLSIFCRDLAGHHPYAYSLENLGFYYREYERLIHHWRKVLPLAMLDVDYEALVGDREQQTRRLVAFCDLPWDARCLALCDHDRAAPAAGPAQRRPPMDRDLVGWAQPYAKHLGPLQAALRGQGGYF